MSLPDHYSVLGVDRHCSVAEIKKSYKHLALAHHPDKSQGDADKFKQILEAYNVLIDEDLRKEYDTSFFGSSGTSGLSGLFNRANNARTRFRGESYGFYHGKTTDSHAGSEPFTSNMRSEPRQHKQQQQQSSSRNSKKDAFYSTYKPGFYQYYQSYNSSKKNTNTNTTNNNTNTNTGNSPRQKFYSSTFSRKYWPFKDRESGGTNNNSSSTAGDNEDNAKTHENANGVKSEPTSFQMPPRKEERQKPASGMAAPGGSESELSDGDTTPQANNRRRYFAQSSHGYQSAWDGGYRSYRESSATNIDAENGIDSDSSLEELNEQQFHSPENNDDTYFEGDQEETKSRNDDNNASSSTDENNNTPVTNNFVDLTADDEQQQQENGEANMHTYQQETKGTTRKRTPFLESEEENSDSDDLETAYASPKKRPRTSNNPKDDYRKLRDDFIHVAPFTQTNGNFNMHGIYDSINGDDPISKKRSTPVPEPQEGRKEFIDNKQSQKAPKVDTTFTPVNTSRPRTFQFYQQDHPPAQQQPDDNPSMTGLVDMHSNPRVLDINPPIPPQAPNNSMDIQEFNRYTARIEAYQKQWEEYSSQIMTYHAERQQADGHNGLSYFLSLDHTRLYMQALQQDLKVRVQWQNSLNMHIAVINEYIRYREFLDYHQSNSN